jgi:uncharacterized MAPEG superfamily protein
MTIALWSLLIGSLLPYVWFGVAAPLRKAEFGVLENDHPRLQEAKTTGRGARALGAHANAFEAIAVWAPAVLAAHMTNPTSTLAPKIAIGWVIARVVHGVLYVAGISAARSLCFAVGLICAVLMYLVAGGVI